MQYPCPALSVKPRCACQNGTATRYGVSILLLFAFCLLSATGVSAQTPILTQHYDNGRTGQNTGETILTRRT